MRLVVSLATRGRPQKLLETLAADLRCLSQSNTALMVQVDEDDPQTVMTLSNVLLDKRVIVNVKPREDTIAAKWNRALQEPADVYVLKGDDDPFVTPETDGRILAAASLFPDGIGMVYGHLANASFAGIIGFSRKFADLMGYLQPEYFPYWFCDHWTDDIGRIVGRIAHADVRTDQSRVGQTQEMREPAWWATWFDACRMARREMAKKVLDATDDPAWRKNMQYSAAPLVEYRSKWINDNVRLNARQLEWTSVSQSQYPLGAMMKDERYLRTKKRAMDLLPSMLAGMPEVEARQYIEVLTPPTNIAALPVAI